MKNSFIALIAVLLAGCAPQSKIASPFDDPQVVAIVGGEKITKADLDAARARRPAPAAAILDELIEHRALVQEARAKGYDRDPQMLHTIEKMLANRIREEHRQAADPEIPPAEIEARYQAAQKSFTVPAKIRAAMIFVEAPKNFSEEKRTERRAAIDAAWAAAKETPEKFAALAAEYSYDQATKFRGGDLGYLVEKTGADELEPEVLAAAFALRQPGDLSEIITTAKGFHFVKLTERTEATVRPLAEVRAKIRADLQREKQQRSDKDFTAFLHAGRKIETRPDRLPTTTPPSQHVPNPPSAPELGSR